MDTTIKISDINKLNHKLLDLRVMLKQVSTDGDYFEKLDSLYKVRDFLDSTLSLSKSEVIETRLSQNIETLEIIESQIKAGLAQIRNLKL